MDDTFASSPRHDAYAARRYARLDVARGPARPAPPAPSKPAARPEPTAADVLLDLDFRRLFGYLARRKLWIAAAAVIGVGAGLAYGVLAPARYTATAEVLVDPSSLQVVSNDLYSSSGQTDAMVLNVESKMRVLTSNQVFARVVDQLHLTADPEFTSYRTLAPEDSALKVMQDIVKVSRDDKSFVVTLSATTSNGEKSVRLASAVVDAFRADLADSDAAGASRAAGELDQRLSSLKADVTQAESVVEDFRRAHGLETSQGELASAQAMAQVNTQFLAAQAKLIDLKSRVDKLTSGSPDSLMSAAAQESTTISALRAQYAATREQAQALKATLGPLHPSVRAIEAQVTSLQGQINAETARIVQAARSDVEQAQASVDQLQAEVDASKSAVASDNSAQVTLRGLQREADSRAAIYEAYLTRAKEIAEREQIDTTNIRVISAPMVPPTRSFPPPTVQLVGLGAAAGLALGALAALVLGLVGERRRFPPAPRSAPAGKSAPQRSGP
jgi:uncharacterized protein involved in exopolysaccharide biosynthesis